MDDCAFSPLPDVPRLHVTVRERAAMWATPINAKRMIILFDWMFETIIDIGHTPDTAEVAFKLLRLFLVNARVPASEHQLAGVVAIWLATKMCKTTADDKMRVPTVDELTYRTADSCSKSDIIAMECRMLARVNYVIPFPCVCDFVLKQHPELPLSSYEFHAIMLITLVCMTKIALTKSLVNSVISLVLNNAIDEKIITLLQNHYLPSLCKWFSNDVIYTVRHKYNVLKK